MKNEIAVVVPKIITLPQLISKRPLIQSNPFKDLTLPEKVWWSASSMKMWKKCRRKWFWKYILGVSPRRKSGYLVIGSAFHECLAHWYRGPRVKMKNIAGRYVSEAAHLIGSGDHDFKDQERIDKFLTTVNTMAGMMMGYEGVYFRDKLNWEINRKQIEMPFKLDYGDYGFVGKVDLAASEVKRKKTHNFVVEHKTASRIDTAYIDQLPLDTQCRGYILGAKKGLSLKLEYILYDVVKKCKLRKKANETSLEFDERVALDYQSRPDFYFYREPLRFSQSDVDSLEYEIYQVDQEYKEVCKNLEILDPREFAPNDGACNDFFTLCEYHPLCTTGLNKGTAMQYDQRDPMDHEVIEEVD